VVKPKEIRIIADGARLITGGHHGEVTKTLVQLTDPGAGTIKFQKRLSGLEDAEAALADCAYRDELTKADVTAGTTQTAAGLYSIEAEGCDIYIVTASFAAAFSVWVRSVAG
jgi:hypothetical protein